MISDGASVMKALHSKTEGEKFICMLHGIHQAVKSAVVKSNDINDTRGKINPEQGEVDDAGNFTDCFDSNLKSSITKMKKIVTTFHHSAILSERLANYCKEAGKRASKFLTVTEIRWNSLFLSIKRLLNLQLQVSKSIMDENDSRPPVILYKFKLGFIFLF